MNFLIVLFIIQASTNTQMIESKSTPNKFRPISYSSIKPATLSETRVSIQNEFGKEIRSINFSSREDGIVEIEMLDVAEAVPFSFTRG